MIRTQLALFCFSSWALACGDAVLGTVPIGQPPQTSHTGGQPNQPQKVKPTSKYGTVAGSASLGAGLISETIHIVLAWHTQQTQVTPVSGDPTLSVFECPQREGSYVELSTGYFLHQAVSMTVETTPLEFEIPVDTTPPEAARYYFDDGVSYEAMGIIYVYRDSNGNGTLDLGAPGTAGDEVIGASRGVGPASQEVLFIEGNVPSGYRFPGAAAGLSAVRHEYSEANQQWELIVEPIAAANFMVVVTDEPPLLSSLRDAAGCAQVEHHREYVLVPDADATLICASPIDPDDGVLDALWTSPSAQQAIAPCTVLDFRGGRLCLGPGETPPADWPCGL